MSHDNVMFLMLSFVSQGENKQSYSDIENKKAQFDLLKITFGEPFTKTFKKAISEKITISWKQKTNRKDSPCVEKQF